MLKESINGKKIDFFEFIKKKKIAFELLKIFFIRALILIHFKFDKSIKIKISINISNFALIGILSQLENK
jgi:hypothetical protein